MSDKNETKQNSKPLSISKFLYSVTKRFYLNFNTQGVVEGKYLWLMITAVTKRQLMSK